MKKWIGITLKTILPLALGVYLIGYFFTSMNPEAERFFYKAVGEADYIWIFFSLVMSFFALTSRAYRWRYVLEPLGYTPRFWHRYHALMIGYIVNLTIPRAGEASRAAMLYRSDGVPFSKSFGTILAERAVDLVMLFSVTALTVFFGSDDFWKIKTEMSNSVLGDSSQQKHTGNVIFYVFLSCAAAGLIILYFFKKIRTKLLNFISNVFQGVFSIFKTKNPLAFIGHTLFIWLMYVCYFAITFLCLDEVQHVPFTGIMIAFIAGALGISFTNGGVGSFPLLVGLVVNFYLADEFGAEAQGIGYALGMIIWVSQTVFMIVLGLISLYLIPKNFKEPIAKEVASDE